MRGGNALRRIRCRAACSRLADNERLACKEGVSLYALAVLEATVCKKRLPLLPREKRRVLANTLRIAALAEEPPAVRQAKRDLRERIGLDELIDKYTFSLKD